MLSSMRRASCVSVFELIFFNQELARKEIEVDEMALQIWVDEERILGLIDPSLSVGPKCVDGGTRRVVHHVSFSHTATTPI